MKKTCLVMTLAIALTSIAFADSNVISSANIVGYVQKEVPAGGTVMLANPFLNNDKLEMSIDEIFGDSMPDGTELFVYDNGYTGYTYYDGMGWVNSLFQSAGDIVIARGQSLWVKNPTASVLEITLSGNVPGNDADSLTNNIPSGIVMMASAYPATNTISGLGFNPADGDEIHLFNSGYQTYTYYSGMGWVNSLFTPAEDTLIDLARGFWYKTSTPQIWVETKPYSDF